MDVGFIGIGSMGAAMVPHLVKAGHRVQVWNRNPAAAQALNGVTVLASAAEVFAHSEVMITMLSDDAVVRSVVVDSGALAGARKGSVHVMASTISVALVDELLPLHQQAGVAYVGAPVFGVPAAAAAAQLNILAAGPAAALATVQPLFDVLGQKTWHLGDDPRRAHITKIGGNMMIALALEAMAEASALTESYGLSAADFLNVLTNTVFACPSYQRYGGKIARADYEPGFKLTLGLKDVNLALSAAQARRVVLPAATAVQQNMHQAVEKGWGQRDWSIVAQLVKETKPG